MKNYFMAKNLWIIINEIITNNLFNKLINVETIIHINFCLNENDEENVFHKIIICVVEAYLRNKYK